MDITTPFSMVIAGPSGSGKTVFISKFLKLFKLPVTYAYAMYQPLFTQMKEDLNVQFVEGCPSIDTIENNSIVVLDDLMLECGKEVAELFTRMRHRSVSVIFVLQNLFFQNKNIRTITLNTNFLVIFQSPRDVGVITTLGRQMYPGKPKYITTAFEDATSKPYGYLFLDLRPHAEFRVRTGILPGEEQFAYLPKG